MAVKNWMYGTLAPTFNADAVRMHLYRGHLYKNKLIEIELERRKQADDCACRVSPEYAAAKQAYDAASAVVCALYTKARDASRTARKRVVLTDEQDEAISVAKSARKAAYDAVKAASKSAYKRISELQAPLREEAKQAANPKATETANKMAVKLRFLELAEAAGVDAGEAYSERETKKARAECGIFWGSYLTIEDAMKDIRKGAPPRFKPWLGHGVIGVQLQGGLKCNECLNGEDRRLRIYAANLDKLAEKGRLRGRESFGDLWMRLGTVPGKSDPIWTKVPMIFHRAMPKDGVIKYAYLHRQRIGVRERWQLRLSVEFPDAPRVLHPGSEGKIAAFHPGWRLMSDRSLRVGVLVDSDGHFEEICLDSWHVSGFFKSDGLESLRDNILNRKVWKFLWWYDKYKDQFPEWFLEMTKDIHLWKSQQRFRNLFHKWLEQRLSRIGMTRDQFWELGTKERYTDAGYKSQQAEVLDSIEDAFPFEKAVFTILNRWRKTDRHLLAWSADQRSKVALRRKDIYRCVAKRLAQRYEKIVLADTNWADAMQKPDIDEEPNLTSHQRHYGRIASPGQLVQFLKEAFGEMYTVLVSQKHMTASCHSCGEIVLESDIQKRRMRHVCKQCGTYWDIDENGARNQLQRALHPELVPEPVEKPKKVKQARPNRKKSQTV